MLFRSVRSPCRLTGHGDRHAGIHMHRGLAGMEIEMSGMRRDRCGQHHVVSWSRAEAVLAFMQPQEAGDGEPAIVGPEFGFVALPPLLDGLLIRRIVQWQRAAQQCERQQTSPDHGSIEHVVISFLPLLPAVIWGPTYF